MGRSAGEKSVEAFEAFIAEREKLKDWDDYVTANRSQLWRGKIVKACDFSRSVLQQNKVVAGRLIQLEKDLRERSILQGVGDELNECPLEFGVDRDERIQNLENRTEKLESSIDELRQSIEDVEQQIDEILSS
jgi:hypothetical protein